MTQQERVSCEVAAKRLSQFEHLSQLLGGNWLEREFRKTVEQYSLIAGWLTVPESEWEGNHGNHVKSLDNAIAFLAAKAPSAILTKVERKIKAHSDRAELKGTLAEVSLAVFLVEQDICFDMETRLVPDSEKDVDFRLQFSASPSIHVEVQWLSQSERSRREDEVSAQYGLCVPISFELEDERIRNKIYDKIKKFSPDAITIVALEFTENYDLVNPGISIPIALAHSFETECEYQLSERDSEIRRLVDGVIWFQGDTSDRRYPIKRGFILNKFSEHYGFLVKNMTWWS